MFLQRPPNHIKGIIYVTTRKTYTPKEIININAESDYHGDRQLYPRKKCG